DTVRRVDVEGGARADRWATDTFLRLPLRDLRREHVLARSFVPTAPDHPDLVPVVDDRRSPEQVEQRVAELDPVLELGSARARLLPDQKRCASDVVIPEEGRRGGRDPVRAPEV